MTQRILSHFLLFTLSFFFLASCSKYEEGNASLASKKSRLVNHWRTQQITSNGTDITSLNIITDIIIRDNNTMTINGAFWGVPTTAEAKWVFNAKKTNVLITNSDGSLDDYAIVMLQKDEAKFRRIDDDGNVILYHFVTY
ncbi:MAG: hypothetical protein A3D92_13990 [Bacteroidetes bacterium RIFCSPHIGHO2_02_FULL_44_7]|nr:MAG: hypothetical protein A3D92_13990 [Bacteroidetes bacterium RIFCSPHIGHO2_02_FULL_44_7]